MLDCPVGFDSDGSRLLQAWAAIQGFYPRPGDLFGFLLQHGGMALARATPFREIDVLVVGFCPHIDPVQNGQLVVGFLASAKIGEEVREPPAGRHEKHPTVSQIVVAV